MLPLRFAVGHSLLVTKLELTLAALTVSHKRQCPRLNGRILAPDSRTEPVHSAARTRSHMRHRQAARGAKKLHSRGD
jgi:hypothetical protein